MKLNRNDRRVLRFLIENGRTHDAGISRSLNITPQAVGKIRRKLESNGIIKGYSTIVDYEKLGIHVLAVALFKFTPASRKTLTEKDINERVKGEHITNFYRVPEGDITHIVTYGFRSLEELDNYFHVLQTERGHISEIKKLFIFSAKSIRKNSDRELFLKILKESGRERLARPMPPRSGEKSGPKLKRKSLADMG
jgi:DNA-binding Lrp family transcriptional regulator